MPRTPSMHVTINGLARYPAGLTLPCFKIGTRIQIKDGIRTEQMNAYVNMNEGYEDDDDDAEEISLGSHDTEEEETQEFPTRNDAPVSQESQMSEIIPIRRGPRARGPPLRLRGPKPPPTTSVVPDTPQLGPLVHDGETLVEGDQFWTEELVEMVDAEIENRKKRKAEAEKEWKLIRDDDDHDDNFCTICSQDDEQGRRIGRPWEIQCLHCPRGLCVSCTGQLRGHKCPFCRQNMFSHGLSDESEVEDSDDEYVPPPPRRRRR